MSFSFSRATDDVNWDKLVETFQLSELMVNPSKYTFELKVHESFQDEVKEIESRLKANYAKNLNFLNSIVFLEEQIDNEPLEIQIIYDQSIMQKQEVTSRDRSCQSKVESIKSNEAFSRILLEASLIQTKAIKIIKGQGYHFQCGDLVVKLAKYKCGVKQYFFLNFAYKPLENLGKQFQSQFRRYMRGFIQTYMEKNWLIDIHDQLDHAEQFEHLEQHEQYNQINQLNQRNLRYQQKKLEEELQRQSDCHLGDMRYVVEQILNQI